MTDAAGHTTAEHATGVRRISVFTRGRRDTLDDAVERLEAVAREARVELVAERDGAQADLAVVLGGDGTMLRALQRYLGTDVPVIGVNFGRVGFLASIQADELESGLARALAGDFGVMELATLEAEIAGTRHQAVNDVVAASAVHGKMVELRWAVGGEDLGVLPCDGIICATPSGSTAYNLSNGGPVLMWGLDAMAITFIAPHSLHARPLVVPFGRDVTLSNETADIGVLVLVDGRQVGEAAPQDTVTVRLGAQRSRLATLPERTFFTRYRETFTH
jgi:NAD+ kinase